MALHFSRACQTVFAYRLLTARLLKRFTDPTLNWCWVDVTCYRGWDSGRSTLTAAEVRTDIWEGRVATLEAKVWFLATYMKSLELFREAVNSWAWFSEQLNTKLNSEKQWWILPFQKRIQGGKEWLAYLKVWAFHWCISQGSGSFKNAWMAKCFKIRLLVLVANCICKSRTFKSISRTQRLKFNWKLIVCVPNSLRNIVCKCSLEM